MVEIKELTKDQLSFIVAEKGFEPLVLTKDYYITILLYLLKDINGIYFKGGTALNKTILGYSRLSEDIDFTLEKSLKDAKKEIISLIESSKMFNGISMDKDVEGFTRLVISYSTELGKGTVSIDLNERGRLLTKPSKMPIKHFYPNLPKFELNCLSPHEMIAEKLAAAIGRNMPRDHFDIYMIIKKKIPLDLEMAKKKCEGSGHEFNVIRMFNKAEKLRNRWDEDLLPLLAEEESFRVGITTLAKHFRLNEEKDKIKNEGKDSR